MTFDLCGHSSHRAAHSTGAVCLFVQQGGAFQGPPQISNRRPIQPSSVFACCAGTRCFPPGTIAKTDCSSTDWPTLMAVTTETAFLKAHFVRFILASDVCALCFALQNGTFSSSAPSPSPTHLAPTNEHPFAACFPDNTIANGETYHFHHHDCPAALRVNVFVTYANAF